MVKRDSVIRAEQFGQGWFGHSFGQEWNWGMDREVLGETPWAAETNPECPKTTGLWSGTDCSTAKLFFWLIRLFIYLYLSIFLFFRNQFPLAVNKTSNAHINKMFVKKWYKHPIRLVECETDRNRCQYYTTLLVFQYFATGQYFDLNHHLIINRDEAYLWLLLQFTYIQKFESVFYTSPWIFIYESLHYITIKINRVLIECWVRM